MDKSRVSGVFNIKSSKKETPCLKNCILFEYLGEYKGGMGFVGILLPIYFFVKFKLKKRGVSFLDE